MVPLAAISAWNRSCSDSPNEKFSLSSFHGGTRSVAYLYQELAGIT